MDVDETARSSARSPFQWRAMWVGLALAVAIQLSPPPAGLQREAWIVASLVCLMGVWWVTEAVPIPITSLLPLVVLPLLGVSSLKEAAAGYAHPVVILLLGGFIIAKAVERWGLHERVALTLVARTGARPAAMVGGFMAAAALLSMWISNTATALMMTPIALSVARAVLSEAGERDLAHPFTFCLLLGIAYSASLGGLGTPVGTPTNLIVLGMVEEEAGLQVSFAQWMMLGLPVVAVMVPAAWFVLVRWVYPAKLEVGDAGIAHIRAVLRDLGPISVPEVRVLATFGLIAGLWIFRQPLQGVELFGVRPFGGLTDHVTAILGAVLFFMLPAGSKTEKGAALLDWESAATIPWGVYLLFGGGLSLAAAITSSGLAEWAGTGLSALTSLPTVLLVLILTAFVIFTTEIVSNVATASALTPIVLVIAVSGGADVMLLSAPIAMAASCAFMLPMATGPNAVVFASGRLTIEQMMRAGLALNLIGIVVITILMRVLTPLVFAS